MEKRMRAIGIDIGTTTISAVVVNLTDYSLEKSYTVANESFISSSRKWEKIQDANGILQKTEAVLEEILETYQDIQWIGLTGQMHGILYMDKAGNSLSPLYTWQDESGKQPYKDGKNICEILKESYGIVTYSGYGLITYLYQKDTHLVPKDTAQVGTIADYLGMKLTHRSRPLMHHSNAAGLGLFDVEKDHFMEEMLTDLGGEKEILPEVTADVKPLGTYKGIPVYVAIGDNQASFLGAVRERKDAALVNIGTGGQISVCVDSCEKVHGIEVRPYLKGNYLLVGASLCGGRAYAVLERFFHLYGDALGSREIDHYKVMEQLLNQENEEGKAKLKVCTTFSGTRDDMDKRGFIQNIHADNFTPGALIKGVLEGMAEELHEMYGCMEKAMTSKNTVLIASGNGIRKNVHLQKIMMQKFSMELELAEQKEEAAFGAALSAKTAIK